jgi:hypothetical protein
LIALAQVPATLFVPPVPPLIVWTSASGAPEDAAAKVAVTLAFELRVVAQVEAVVQLVIPVQDVNVHEPPEHPELGVSVNVIAVPWRKVPEVTPDGAPAVQVAFRGAPVRTSFTFDTTVPVPCPPQRIARVLLTGVTVNVDVTVFAADIITVQGDVVHPPPANVLKVELVSAVAVRVTLAPVV